MSEALRLEQVGVQRSTGGVARRLLDGIDWVAGRGEHWGILGPNGAGKSTLLRVASAQMRPSSGVATVLGARLGRVPLASLRPRIGLVDAALARRFYPDQRAIDVVVGGLAGSILLSGARSGAEFAQARASLAAVGVAELETRRFASLSEGERARVMLARALVSERELLALDEPAAGLDVAGRELLLSAFARAVSERPELTTLTVTHHVEELAPTTSHALLVRAGCLVAAGPIDQALTDESLSACFGLRLRVSRDAGRITVRAAG